MTTEQSWSTILEFFLKGPKAGQTTIWKCTKFQEEGREAKETSCSLLQSPLQQTTAAVSVAWAGHWSL